MCVLALAWHADPDRPLVVAANRDERHARAAAPLARWPEQPEILAGRDLVAGGTWLGVSEAGRFAAVTNIAGQGAPDPDAPSRGQLVTDLLTSADRLQDFTIAGLSRYNPCNVIAVVGQQAWLATNRPLPRCTPLPSGLHSVANAPCGTIWPKMDLIRTELAAWLGRDDPADALADRLGPTIGGSRDREADLFILDPVYGTRCTTIMVVHRKHGGSMFERRYDPAGGVIGESRIGFTFGVGALLDQAREHL